MNANAHEFLPEATTMTRPSSTRTFHYFTELQEELAVNILSFLADVPYEESTALGEGTLTHTFPLVCKQFNLICRSHDYLWMIAMERIIKREPKLWGGAMQEFLDSDPNSADEGDQQSTSLDKACRLMEQFISTDEIQYSIHGQLYRHLLSNHIRYNSPVFYMPDETMSRGSAVELHFFEPRYRRLIREVMEPYPDEFRNGAPTNRLINPPTFIYGNRSPLKTGQVAMMVQVMQCYVADNGTANVLLMPLEHVRIEHIWEQAEFNDHLYFIRVMRMREEEQNQIAMNDMRRIAMHQRRREEVPVHRYVDEVLRALGRRDGNENDEEE